MNKGMWNLLAGKFVDAALAQPTETVAMALALWQILVRVGQQPPNEAEKRIVAFLQADQELVDIIHGRILPQDGTCCRPFSDHMVIYARQDAHWAVLINGVDRSLRFFEKARWAPGFWDFKIISPVGGEVIRISSTSIVEDMEWNCIVMKARRKYE